MINELTDMKMESSVENDLTEGKRRRTEEEWSFSGFFSVQRLLAFALVVQHVQLHVA